VLKASLPIVGGGMECRTIVGKNARHRNAAATLVRFLA
jgi:hypothetical protein